MKLRHLMFLLFVMADLAALPMPAEAQALTDSRNSSIASTNPVQLDFTYVRPTHTTRQHNYLFDAYGPYPIIGAAFVAGINQADDTPPEWRQGAAGYGKRFVSDFGIATVSTTTRYALAEALKEDTLYYRCDCKGVLPRLRHAVISTLTARRGEDGHQVLSLPAIVAPYAGTMTAVYGWYPSRYDTRYALRAGNYSLLSFVGGNVALEFIYSGPHSLLSHMHLNNKHLAAVPSTDR